MINNDGEILCESINEKGGNRDVVREQLLNILLWFGVFEGLAKQWMRTYSPKVLATLIELAIKHNADDVGAYVGECLKKTPHSRKITNLSGSIMVFEDEKDFIGSEDILDEHTKGLQQLSVYKSIKAANTLNQQHT